MRVRGERTCENCGTTWSYFETGAVACPECGSLHSTGRGERTRHTDRSVDLDLDEPRKTAAAGALDDALDEAADRCLAFVRRRGFVDRGTLRDLDEPYVFAQELRHAATLSSRLQRSDAERAYLLSLFEDAPTRPPVEAVPDSHRAVRGLAAATAVRDYRDEVRTWLDDEPECPEGRALLESLGDHVKRVRALDGEVDPETADALVDAARAVGRYCRERSDETLEAAREAVDELR
jgi:uncharacterized Zn finger protein (UPF0148 family)